MQSVTMDVISIRARKTKHRIIYCIVDEYQEDYKLSQKTSTEPLTLRQIISIFDNAQEDGGLINHAHNINYKWSDDGAEALYDFVCPHSRDVDDLSPYKTRYLSRRTMPWLRKVS